MVFQVPIYRAEREAGLEELISSTARIAYAAEAKPSTTPADSKILGSLKHLLDRAKGSTGDFDLYPLDTILVSTGWNLNDDVFDTVETFLARRTPEDKQLNYEHDCSRIVGHITSSCVIDDESKPVADDIVIEDIPASFHILTGAVLYKQWDKEDLQEQMDTLLAEIAKGEWYVSMECLFKGFDYALDGPSGKRVVARNDKTAFLSKHLRSYGGTGKYGSDKVGRLLRNIVFSGKGLVKKPANPESIIFPNAHSFASSGKVFSKLTAEQVYSPSAKIPEIKVDIDTLKAELAALKAEHEKLKAGQQETAVAELKTKLAKAESDKADADALLVKAKDALKAASDEAVASKAKFDESEKALSETRDELKKVYAEQTTKDRVSTVKEKLKLSDADAADFVATVASLSAEQFTKQVDLIAKQAVAAQTPPKATPKPVAPKATSKPLAPKSTAEVDASGEAAAETDLAAAEGSKEAVLNAVASTEGVSEVRKQIAAFLGAEEAE
jgi:hypothetical protein